MKKIAALFLCLPLAGPLRANPFVYPQAVDPLAVQWIKARSIIEEGGVSRDHLLSELDGLLEKVIAFRADPVYPILAGFSQAVDTELSRLQDDILSLAGALRAGVPLSDELPTVLSMDTHIANYLLVRIAFAERVNGYYLLIILFFVFLFVFVIILVGLFRLRLNTSTRKEAQTTLFAQTIINTQEAERVSIARELHDTIAQDILCIKVATETMHYAISRTDTSFEQSFCQLIEMETDCINRIRQVCAEIRPPELDHLGLKEAVSELCAGFESKAGIACRFRFIGAFSLPKASEINCYRIVQESLSNVRKHADARSVFVELRQLPGDILQIQVEDDGKGIDLKGLEDESGATFGLKGMRERAGILGGTLAIGRGSAGGTRVVARIPLTDLPAEQ